MAVLALQIVGTVIGTMIGGPIGGAIGGAIGATVGNLLFPQKFSAPPLPELHVQRSSNGAFIPVIYGNCRAPAIIVDAPDKFTANEETSGGKGGPEVTTRSYSIDWLDCMFCESRGQHSLGRVWHTGRLVGDYRVLAVQAGELPLVFYNGAADQMPDPTEESHYGVGMLSARRGVARTVYTNLGLGENANTLAIVNAEMVSITPPVEGPIISILQNDATGFTWPNITAPSDWTPAFPAIMTWPRNGDPIRVRERNEPTVRTYNSTTLAYIGSEAVGDDEFPQDAAYAPDSEWHFVPIGFYVYDDDTRTALWAITGTSGTLIAVGNNFPAISSTLPVGTGAFPSVNITGTNWIYPAGVPSGEYHVGSTPSQDGRIMLVLTGPTAASNADKWYRIVNGTVESSGTVSPTIAFGAISYTSLYAFTNTLSLENNGRWLWHLTSNTKLATVYYIDDAGNLAFNVLGGSFNVSADPAISACCIATLATDGYAGVVYLDTLALLSRLVPGEYEGIRLWQLVADQHTRCGDDPSAYDVTELVDVVRGCGIFAPPTGRSAIESWEDIYAFKPVDSDTGVKYVKLGKPSIVTIPDGDLCAHDENGSDIPSPLQVVLGNDLELPCQIWLKYMDWNADYQTGAQQWHRQNTLSKIVRTIETAVVLTAQEAKQIVEAIGQRTLVEADKYTWYTTRGGTALDANGDPLPYIKLEGTDVVTVKGLDLRIETKLEQMATGIIKWTGVRSHPGVVVQTGAGSGESEGFTPQEIVEAQETELALIDGPFIGDDPRQGLIPVVMQGALRRSWKGAALMKSLDGTNYSQILAERSPGTIGETLTALGNYGGVSFDESNVLRVLIPPGGDDLVSVSRNAAFAGENMFVVGHDDAGLRGEIGNFKNSTLVSEDAAGKVYDITGILRGRYGTRPWMRGHAVGEKFCMLPSNSSLSLLRSDLAIARNHKSVTFGRTLASASVYPFRSNGLPLAAYAPAFVRAGFTGTPGASDILIKWNRRSRLNQGWLNFRSPTGAGQPLGEETEGYRVRIYEDGTKQVVLNMYDDSDGITTTQFIYTQAMQTADFGSLLSTLPALNVAQKCSIGWGYDSDGGVPTIVPSIVAGYVPPNPPPVSGILSVMNWAAPVRIFSGPFGPNDTWSIQFTTGSVPSPSNNFVVLAAAEYQGPYVTRQWTLSPIRGDFGPQLKPGAAGEGNAVAVFAVGTDDYPFYPTVPFLSTWYLNIRNTPSIYFDMQMDCEIANVP